MYSQLRCVIVRCSCEAGFIRERPTRRQSHARQCRRRAPFPNQSPVAMPQIQNRSATTPRRRAASFFLRRRRKSGAGAAAARFARASPSRGRPPPLARPGPARSARSLVGPGRRLHRFAGFRRRVACFFPAEEQTGACPRCLAERGPDNGRRGPGTGRRRRARFESNGK